VVFKFAINAVEKSINRLLELDQTQLSFITKIITHQANYRINEAVADESGYEVDESEAADYCSRPN
jgi:3-oxoacyl-[acyl-carrier-protein] synthase-3